MNRNFGKVKDGNLTLAPDSVRVIIRHHDEWDEPVFDENGNETGEVTHQTSDWEEERTVIFPTESDYANAKDGPWLPNDYAQPDPPEGQHAVSSHWEERNGRNVNVWEYAPDAPKVRVFKVCELFWWVAQKGLAAELDALLESQGLYSAAITQTEVSDADPNFVAILAAVQDALDLTYAEVDECLTAAEVW